MEVVAKELDALVEALRPDDPVVGPLDDNSIRMPISNPDGRALTWRKFAGHMTRKLINQPRSIRDCWFIASNKADGYHQTKLSTTGANNKKQTHCVAFLLANPRSSLAGLHVAHRCGLGKAKHQGGPSCINPHHLVAVVAQINQDQKGCKYGTRRRCPHKPHCLFNWPDTGLEQPCFNADSVPSFEDCPHERKCILKPTNRCTGHSPAAFPPQTCIRPTVPLRCKRSNTVHAFAWD